MNSPPKWTPAQKEVLLGDAVKESLERRFGVALDNLTAQKLAEHVEPTPE